MVKLIENNGGNFLLICFIVGLVIFWIFSGWPQIWQKPPVPPEIKIVEASPDIETLRPQSHDGLLLLTTNPLYAYDAAGTSTQSDTEYDADAVAEATFYDWPSAGQTYGTTTLKLYYNAQAAPDDTYEIEYSIDNTSGACDSTTWTDLVAPTSDAAAAHTLVSANLSASQELTELCVRLNIDKVPGPDNKLVFIEDIKTEGDYDTILSISVSDGNVAYGQLDLSATNSTIALTDTQIVTNDGGQDARINVKSSDAVGTTTNWDLENTIGDSQYVHQYSSTSAANWDYFPNDNSYDTLQGTLPFSGNDTTSLDIQVQAPQTTNDYLKHDITVTVQATSYD